MVRAIFTVTQVILLLHIGWLNMRDRVGRMFQAELLALVLVGTAFGLFVASHLFVHTWWW